VTGRLIYLRESVLATVRHVASHICKEICLVHALKRPNFVTDNWSYCFFSIIVILLKTIQHYNYFASFGWKKTFFQTVIIHSIHTYFQYVSFLRFVQVFPHQSNVQTISTLDLFERDSALRQGWVQFKLKRLAIVLFCELVTGWLVWTNLLDIMAASEIAYLQYGGNSMRLKLYSRRKTECD